ncbi:uncharacterized protein KGF55_004324 [Candida pseudojiufengensis]|uniref:uncharacterized protein n=1 Tax=Candida pseudojiufengensis TaxID=497109 RepID=UPI0022252E4D|nr:uncharacterized protein KGF55_004324 [Candida pseudojiufengensis]KAI5960754.1 hypothetical protein KGF55_004324 [Candida pseudojiufengensis]
MSKETKDIDIKVEKTTSLTSDDVESLSLSNTISFSKQDKDDAKEIFYHDNKLSSTLNARIITMISLVGVIGTGLFLSSGGTLATAGPVGMILAYVVVGSVVAASLMSVAEVSCLSPNEASYVSHAEHFVDKSFGFVIGICDIYANIIPNELAAVSVLMTYWTDINPAVFITIFGLTIVIVNGYNVKWYGEIEFYFGIIKILLCVGLILLGLIIDLGGIPGDNDRIGFRYWINPGPFAERYTTGSLGKFLGFWKAINSAVYAFSGIQNITLLAGEIDFPRRSIYRASKRVFIRVFGLYIVMIVILSMIVPHNDPLIAESNGTASGSPWVRAISLAGIKVLPSIVNAVVLTSALSSGNLQVVKASRTIYVLASKRQLPKIFLKVNKHGLPYVAVGFTCAFLPLAYMAVSASSSNVFSWFSNVISANTLFSWIVMSVNHIALHRALRAQGFSRKYLPFTFLGKYGEYCGWYSLFFAILFLLTGGFPNFIHGYWSFSTFFSAYFIIPLALVLFIFAKLVFKSKYITPNEVKLKPLFYDVQARPEPPFKKLKGLEWLTLLWA